MTTCYVSTACVRGYPTLEAQLAAYAAAGLDAIELGWAPPPAGDVRAALAAHPQLQTVIHNYFPQPAEPFVLNLASDDATIGARSRAMVEAAIDLAADTGMPFTSVHAGFAADPAPAMLGTSLASTRAVPRGRARAAFCRAMLPLLARADARGVRLLVEPNVVTSANLVGGRNVHLLMADPEETACLVAELAHPAFGVLLDTGHLRVTARTLGFAPTAFLDVVAPHVGALHVHDNDGTDDQHRPVADGSWVLELLQHPAFDRRPLVIEAHFASPAELARHRAWLASRLAAHVA